MIPRNNSENQGLDYAYMTPILIEGKRPQKLTKRIPNVAAMAMQPPLTPSDSRSDRFSTFTRRRMTMNAPKNVIQIHLDGVWAGSGKVDDDGEITECGAVLGPDQDQSDEVYEAISDLIADGAEAGQVRRPEGLYTFDVLRDDFKATADEQREQDAYRHAKAHQGYEGTWEDWQAIDDDERGEYEQGAEGDRDSLMLANGPHQLDPEPFRGLRSARRI